jgi:hypothetical protein
LPFVFLEPGIEYCLSAITVLDEVRFFVSRMDRETYVIRVPASVVLRKSAEHPIEKGVD